MLTILENGLFYVEYMFSVEIQFMSKTYSFLECIRLGLSEQLCHRHLTINNKQITKQLNQLENKQEDD